MQQWVKEFHTWWPSFRVAILHNSGSFTSSPESLVHNIYSRNGILVMPYSSVVIHQDILLPHDWHYVILDEGHKIRNPDAQITVSVKQVISIYSDVMGISSPRTKCLHMLDCSATEAMRILLGSNTVSRCYWEWQTTPSARLLWSCKKGGVSSKEYLYYNVRPGMWHDRPVTLVADYSQVDGALYILLFFCHSSGPLIAWSSRDHRFRITWRSYGLCLTLSSRENWGRFPTLWLTSPYPLYREDTPMLLKSRWVWYQAVVWWYCDCFHRCPLHKTFCGGSSAFAPRCLMDWLKYIIEVTVYMWWNLLILYWLLL